MPHLTPQELWAALVAALLAPSPLIAIVKGCVTLMDLITKIRTFLAAVPWLTSEALDLILVGVALAESSEADLKADLAKAVTDSPLPQDVKDFLLKDSILGAVTHALVGLVAKAQAPAEAPPAIPPQAEPAAP